MSEPLALLLGAKMAAKIGAGLGICMFVFGWLRSRAGRSLGRAILALGDGEDSGPMQLSEHQPRTISRKEWHDINGIVQRLLLQVAGLRDGLKKVQGATAKDHDLLTELRVKVENIEGHLEEMGGNR